MEENIKLVEDGCLGDNSFTSIDSDCILYFANLGKVVFKARKRITSMTSDLSVFEYDFFSSSLKKIEISLAEKNDIVLGKLIKISENNFLLFQRNCSSDPNLCFHILNLPHHRSSYLILQNPETSSYYFSSIVKVREGILLGGMQGGKLSKISMEEKKMDFLQNPAVFKIGESKIIPSKRYENSAFVNSFRVVSNYESTYDTFVNMIDFEKDELTKEFFIMESGINDPMKDMTTFMNKKGDEILITVMRNNEYFKLFDVETNTCIKEITFKEGYTRNSLCLYCSDEGGYLFVGAKGYINVIDLFMDYKKYELKTEENTSINELIPLVSSSSFQFLFTQKGNFRTLRVEGLRMNGMDRMEELDLKERISFLFHESVILRLKIQLENLSLDDLPRIVLI